MPHGYDLYVLGVQECVSDHTLAVIEVRCYPRVHLRRSFARTPLTPPSVDHRHPQDYLHVDGVLRLSLHSGKIVVPLGSHADKTTGRLDRVQGRGDGSFISPKFTGLAVFGGSMARRRYGIKVLRAAVHSFGKTAGSKGGVGCVIRFGQRNLAFISCHLSANNVSTGHEHKHTHAPPHPHLAWRYTLSVHLLTTTALNPNAACACCTTQNAVRRAQYKELVEALGRQLGDRYFQLTEQFHHVFWTGDLNYRMIGLRAAEVLDMLERSQVKELYEGHDGMVIDR